MPRHPGKPITVGRATERYRIWICGNYSSGSIPSVTSVLRKFGKRMDGTLVTDITSEQLAKWKADRMEEGAAGATIAREVSVVRGFFEWLLE